MRRTFTVRVCRETGLATLADDDTGEAWDLPAGLADVILALSGDSVMHDRDEARFGWIEDEPGEFETLAETYELPAGYRAQARAR